MFHFSNLVRSKSDPKIISTGPSSLTSADRLARGLGWFSIALGTLELLAPHRVTYALGMDGREGLVRAYGVRELLAGVLTLSVEKRAGLLSRVAGDGLDMATLLGELRPSNPRAGTVLAALVMVGGIALLDYTAAQDVAAQHDARRGRKRLYNDRSGFPKGIAAARGAALPRPARSTALS
ncbi:hypothetical protein S58_56190 [Bradyrhizobium oligotrophicum S58]|uniref:Uncharacterized protein n=1 Tax=Bradyrhizobium oligotrophicum S58 TaxID=1245469 RepID=M4ZDP9_9BRAD|nr:hypothetical protein [Bradyrhizobium oligotrophicum]BAM91596.1 hypothetical protein S58_56190 [Bradyrhizobium oligotrophicum S58]